MDPIITKAYVPTEHGQIHGRFAGRRDRGKLPLVLLHQTASSSVMFEDLMAELHQDYWLVALDTPGFGGTAALPGKASVAGYAAVIMAALERLEIDTCWLFGHHSGASIATQIAYERPALVTKLALSGPPCLSEAQLTKLVPSVCPVALEPDGAHLMAVWDRIRSKDPTAPLALSHREAVLNLHAGVRYPEAYHAVFEHDLPGQLAALEQPTLVMAGAQDTIRASLEPAYEALQHGEMIAFDTGGTYICDSHPELVAGALRPFFQPDAAEGGA